MQIQCCFFMIFYFILLFVFFQFIFQHEKTEIILMMPQLFGNSFCGFIYDAILVPGGYLIMVLFCLVAKAMETVATAAPAGKFGLPSGVVIGRTARPPEMSG